MTAAKATDIEFGFDRRVERTIGWEGREYHVLRYYDTDVTPELPLDSAIEIGNDGLELCNESGDWRIAYRFTDDSMKPNEVLGLVAVLTEATRLALHLNELDHEAVLRRCDEQIETLQRRVHDGGVE